MSAPAVSIWLLIAVSIWTLVRLRNWYREAAAARKRATGLEQHAGSLEVQVEHLQREIERLNQIADNQSRQVAERKKRALEQSLSDPINQIRFIKSCELRAARPVNKEAVKVLYALDEWVERNHPDWRVSFEVAMGAFIKTDSRGDDRLQKNAFSSYNSKRVDFLLIDRYGDPQLVVEYQGTGHALSDDADDRMAVKRLALQRAHIPLLEIPAKTSKSGMQTLISGALHSLVAA